MKKGEQPFAKGFKFPKSLPDLHTFYHSKDVSTNLASGDACHSSQLQTAKRTVSVYQPRAAGPAARRCGSRDPRGMPKSPSPGRALISRPASSWRSLLVLATLKRRHFSFLFKTRFEPCLAPGVLSPRPVPGRLRQAATVGRRLSPPPSAYARARAEPLGGGCAAAADATPLRD